MTWFKVDDKFHSSVEVMSIIPNKRSAAIGLWCLAGAWSSDQLKDGYVPVTMLKTWGANVDLASILVTAKLWTRVGKTGYRFRNWSKWQITREQVESAREQERERKRNWRESKAQKTQQTPTDVPALSPLSRPDPTRPDPTTNRKSEEVSSAGTTGPYCARHPGGTDKACGPCRTARLAFEAAQKAEKEKPTRSAADRRLKPTECPHKRVDHGYCVECEAKVT